MENTTIEKTYSQMRKNFDELYTNKIVPIVRNYETERKRKLKILQCSYCVLFLTFCVMIVLSDKESFYSNIITQWLYLILEPVSLTVLVITCCIIILLEINRKKMEHRIKEKIMPIVCSCFSNIKWSHSNYKNGDFFIKSRIIPFSKLGIYDDIFSGSYKDVNIEIVESRPPQYGDKNVFHGLFIKMNMNKDFNTHTVLLPTNIVHISPSMKLHYTELEDVKFNKKFDVFTDNDLESRYLLTPSFMEKLKNISLTFNTNKLSCAFFKSYLVIAIPSVQDLFSIGALHISIEDKQQYLKMYDEIISIIKLIDHFKLDQK